MDLFSPARGAEILLRLHDEFHLGLNYCLLENKITAQGQPCFLARAQTPFRLHEIFFKS